MPSTPDARPIYLSRTMLLALGALVAALVQWRWGWALPPEIQLAVVGLLVGLLRIVTDRPVRVRGERKAPVPPPAPGPTP
jgi:hypothetical protein